MDFSNVIYKEIPLDENNISSANLMQNNGVERKPSLKNLKYTQSMGYRLDTKLNVSLPNRKGKNLSAKF